MRLVYKNNGMYVDYNPIDSLQARFNLLNGTRSIGKTYTLQKNKLKKCIKLAIKYHKSGEAFKRYQIMDIIRYTKMLDDFDVLKENWGKVIDNEFKEYEFKFTKRTIFLVYDGVLITLINIVCLSEYQKYKKIPLYRTLYIIFDEYMLENEDGKVTIRDYYKGWNEPDALLSIYHSTDREEDKVIVYMLGNNTTFYNPYHLHAFFKIPFDVKLNEVYLSSDRYISFTWLTASNKLKQKQEKSKFVQRIQGSKYGDSAIEGKYKDDNEINIVEGKGKFLFTLKFNGEFFGVYNAIGLKGVVISNHYEKQSKAIFALDKKDVEQGAIFIKGTSIAKIMRDNLFKGIVFYNDLAIKRKIEKGLLTLF